MKNTESQKFYWLWVWAVVALSLILTLSFYIIPSFSDLPKTSGNTFYLTPQLSWTSVNGSEIGAGSGTFYYTTLGEYPQTYVGDSQNSTLVSYALTEPSRSGTYMSETGNKYEISGTTYIEYQICTKTTVVSLAGASTTTYKYQEEKYVRVPSQKIYSSSSSSSYKFSTGESLGSAGEVKWFKVEPIKWWVANGLSPADRSTNQLKLVSDISLAALPFKKSGESGEIQNMNIMKLSSNFFTSAGLTPYKHILITESEIPGFYAIPPSQQDMATDLYKSGMYLYANSAKRVASPSDFSLSLGAYLYTSSSTPTGYRSDGGKTSCWTSTFGRNNTYAYMVTQGNMVSEATNTVEAYGFRPMITINYTSSASYSSLSSLAERFPTAISYEDGVYLIHSYAGLTYLSAYTNYMIAGENILKEKIALACDIDCGGAWMKAIKNFSGVFDGRGHAIKDLNIIGEYSGFIGESYGGEVRNLYLLDVNIEGTVAGAIMGKAYGASSDNIMYRYPPTSFASSVIQNVYFEGGSVNGNMISGGVAGLVGGGYGLPALSVYETAVILDGLSASDKPLTAAFVGMGVNDTIEVLIYPSSSSKVKRSGTFYMENSYVWSWTTPYAYSSNCGATFKNAYHTYLTVDAIKFGGPYGNYDWGSDDASDIWVRYGFSADFGPTLRWVLLPEVSQALPAQTKTELLSKLTNGFNVFEVTEDTLESLPGLPGSVGPDIRDLVPPGTIIPVPPPSIRPT